ncbi:cytochrome c-type biogenesis protein [Piscinibacter sp. HJYY11]|uniref:cytochrome c-type biogenesis protein n=1 Tax=Piscinibacter sp. HJYY11 TaxID=2801333 RepID=UPI00191D5130|nr:cytochrome c-type biogenesis protein [Piscinibacter sp. HJYY11]MBL0730984.1 cytochrome c-type biogenesis protein CcmH [Piscinibacter sp. HJYY11]
MSARHFLRALLLALPLTLATAALHAKDAAPLADDPKVEARLLHISEELRCLVCQNESLAGSRADLALDLKREIRTLIKQGKTDDEIREFMVHRYGDFVLYRPPVKPTTWLLWAGPFVLMLGGLVALITFLRRRQPADAALSAEEQRRAEALLNDKREAPPSLKGDS